MDPVCGDDPGPGDDALGPDKEGGPTCPPNAPNPPGTIDPGGTLGEICPESGGALLTGPYRFPAKAFDPSNIIRVMALMRRNFMFDGFH